MQISFVSLFVIFTFVVTYGQVLPVDGVELEEENDGGWLSGLTGKIFNIFGRGREDEEVTGIQPATSSAPVSIMAEDEIQKIMQTAQDLLVGGKMEESVDAMLPIVRSVPDHQESNALIGAILLGLQQYEIAEQFLYTAANSSNWLDASSVSNLAQCFLQSNDKELARKTLMRGMEASNRSDVTGALSLSFGDVSFAAGNYSEAADWYLSAALKRPSRIDVWIKASTLRFPVAARDLKFAENVLMQALAMNRDSAELVFHMGLAMHAADRLSEAVTFYQEALRMPGGMGGAAAGDGGGGSSAISTGATRAEAVSSLATALHAQGRLSEALPVYAEATAVMPQNVVLLANYAMLLNAISRTEEALVHAKKALELDSTNADAIRAWQECTTTTTAAGTATAAAAAAAAASSSP